MITQQTCEEWVSINNCAGTTLPSITDGGTVIFLTFFNFYCFAPNFENLPSHSCQKSRMKFEEIAKMIVVLLQNLEVVSEKKIKETEEELIEVLNEYTCRRFVEIECTPMTKQYTHAGK